MTPTRTIELRYAAGEAAAVINGHTVCRSKQTVRIVTDHHGSVTRAVGIASQKTGVVLNSVLGKVRRFTIQPNETVELKI